MVQHELARLEEREIPATPEQIRKTLAVFVAAGLKVEKKSDEDWKILRALYVDDLSDIPGDILDAAAAELRQTCVFFPTIAEIREAAISHAAPRRVRISRLRQMLEPRDEPKREPTAAEKRRNLKVLRKYLDKHENTGGARDGV